MSKVRKVLLLLIVVGAVAGYFQASESTRRYVKHLASQAPDLPYRYFI